MQHFYGQILAIVEILELTSRFGLDEATITGQLEYATLLESAMQEQQHKRAEAQVITRERREAMEALDQWMVEFLGTARLVFRNNKEQLKKMLPAV